MSITAAWGLPGMIYWPTLHTVQQPGIFFDIKNTLELKERGWRNFGNIQIIQMYGVALLIADPAPMKIHH